MVGELVPRPDYFAKDFLPPGHLGPDDEEGGVRAARREGAQDLAGAVGGGIVDRQGDELPGGGKPDPEEDVGPAVGEVADQRGGRFVDRVEREQEDEQDQQEEEQRHYPAAAGPAAVGKAEESLKGWEEVQQHLIRIFFFGEAQSCGFRKRDGVLKENKREKEKLRSHYFFS